MMGFGDSGSAGGEIASAYVLIGADLTGLKAAEQEAQAIVERIGKMVGSVSFGGSIGQAGGGSFPSAGGGSVNGSSGGFSATAGNYGTVGGSFGNSVNQGTFSVSASSFGGPIGGAGGGIQGMMGQAEENLGQQVEARLKAVVQAKIEAMTAGSASSMVSSFQGGQYSNLFNKTVRGLNDVGISDGEHGPSRMSRLGQSFSDQSNFAADTYGSSEFSSMGLAAPSSTFSRGRPGRSGSSRMNQWFDEGMAGAPASMGLGEVDSLAEVVEEIHPSSAMARNIQNQQYRSLYNSTVNDLATGGDGSGSRSRRGSGVGGFGVRGAISRATGIPYAGVVAAGLVAAGSVAAYGEIMGASDRTGFIAQHPEEQLRQYSSVGSGLGLAGNSTIQSLAASSNKLQQSIEWSNSLNNIPIYGHIRGLYDYGEGSTYRMHAESAQNDVAAGTVASISGIQYDTASIRAAQSGNALAIQQTDNFRKLSSAREQEAQSRQNLLTEFNSSPAGRVYSDPSQVLGYARSGSWKTTESDKLVALDDEVHRAAKAVANLANALDAGAGAIARSQGAAGQAAGLRLSADSLTAGRGIGSAGSALALNQSADMLQAGTAFWNEAMPALTSGPLGMPDAGTILNSFNRNIVPTVGAHIGQSADLSRAQMQSIIQSQAGARAASMGVNDPLAAQMIQFNANSQIQLQNVAPLGVDAYNAMASQFSAQSAAMSQMAAQSNSIAMGQLSTSSRQAGLRAARRPYEATLAGFDHEEMVAGYIPFAIQRGAALGEIGARRNAAAVERAQDLQLEGEGYQTQIDESSHILSNQPIAAQAVGAVASARRQVELSTKDNRELAINSAQAQLRAARYSLTAQRGGEVAIDMSVSQALGSMVGSGIDLTGRRADIGAAQAAFDKGIGDMPNAKLTGTGGDGFDAASKENLAKMLGLFTQLMQKAGVISLFN